uniref:Uncharacterized protein n=1 Tax=Oryza glumipatula TaxID=40148 RepID=A0A0D9YNA8_9ORYZ
MARISRLRRCPRCRARARSAPAWRELGQKIKGHFWLTEERCQGRLTLAFQQQHVKLVPFDGVTRAEAGPQVIESWRRSMDGLSVITIQLRFDDQDAMLDDTLTE